MIFGGSLVISWYKHHGPFSPVLLRRSLTLPECHSDMSCTVVQKKACRKRPAQRSTGMFAFPAPVMTDRVLTVPVHKIDAGTCPPPIPQQTELVR